MEHGLRRVVRKARGNGRRIAPVAAAGVAALQCAAAHAEIGGFVLPLYSATKVRESPVNPGNFLGQARSSAQLAAGLHGEMGALSWRASVRHSRAWNGDREHRTTDVSLQELSASFALSDRVTLIAGKRILAWDVAFSSTPLGFFQKTPDLTDVTDRLERAEGLPLVALGFIGRELDLTLVYSDDSRHRSDGFNRGLRQLAANLTWTRPRASYSFVVQKPHDQRAGFGLAASVTLRDDLTAHVSAFTRRGTRRPISLRVLERELVFDTVDPNGSWRLREDERYDHWVVGTSWVGASGTSVTLEWSHDDAGLDHAQWGFWKALVAFHAAGPAEDAAPGMLEGVPPDLAAVNLAYDAKSLLPRGARRDYLFVRVAWPVGTASLSALARTGIADGSTFVNLSAGREFGRRVTAEISLSMHLGRKGTELSFLPSEGSLQAWLKYAF
ncbi:MAG: hypothetical protein DIU56_011575 [Pseudomonadota bacterium]|jgi:hypothetical protein|nr:MAG: hypothetical protein DIU56_14785 [Pseudomonadota bacterium]